MEYKKSAEKPSCGTEPKKQPKRKLLGFGYLSKDKSMVVKVL